MVIAQKTSRRRDVKDFWLTLMTISIKRIGILKDIAKLIPIFVVLILFEHPYVSETTLIVFLALFIFMSTVLAANRACKKILLIRRSLLIANSRTDIILFIIWPNIEEIDGTIAEQSKCPCSRQESLGE